MNSLQQYFEHNESNAINKWMHYFDIYDRYFSKYIGKEVTILEVGVFQGGSLKMWKNYFGEKARIYAIDIMEECKQFEDENIKIFIGSQSDRNFLQSVKKEIPPIDILIDDGGHHMDQQIITFEELYTHIKPDGIYLCEDLHTSYWKSHGGGYRSKKSFIEYTKSFVDYLHAWHLKRQDQVAVDFSKTTYAVHYYDSIIVLEKKPMQQPSAKMTGKVIINVEDFPGNESLATAHQHKFRIRHQLKKILRKFIPKG